MKKWFARFLLYLLDSPLVKNAFVDWIARTAGYTTGFFGGIIKWIADKFYEFTRKHARRPVVKMETDAEVDEQLKEYKEKINDPNATADDIRNAGDDFITR